MLLLPPAGTVLDCKMAVVENLAVDVLVARLEDDIVSGRSMGRLRIRCLVLNRSRVRLEFLPRSEYHGTCVVETVPATCFVVVFVARYRMDLLVNRTRCKTWLFLRSGFRIRCRTIPLLACVVALAQLGGAAMEECTEVGQRLPEEGCRWKCVSELRLTIAQYCSGLG